MLNFKYFTSICVGIMLVTIVYIQVLEAQICERMTFAEFCIEFVKALFENWFMFWNIRKGGYFEEEENNWRIRDHRNKRWMDTIQEREQIVSCFTLSDRTKNYLLDHAPKWKQTSLYNKGIKMPETQELINELERLNEGNETAIEIIQIIKEN